MEPTGCAQVYFKELTQVTVVVWQVQNLQVSFPLLILILFIIFLSIKNLSCKIYFLI